jgi:hypothetical protein
MLAARMPDVVGDHLGRAGLSLHALVHEQPVQFLEGEAVEPVDESVARRRYVLGELGPRLLVQLDADVVGLRLRATVDAPTVPSLA